MQTAQIGYKLKLIYIVFFTLAILLGAVLTVPSVVEAQPYYQPTCCASPTVNPNCVDFLGSSTSGACAETYCTRVSPSYAGVCTPSSRYEISPSLVEGSTVSQDVEDAINVNFFSINIRLDSDSSIQQLLSNLFISFLGISVVVLIFINFGASIQKAIPEAEELPPELQKLVNGLLGFGLIILSLVIAQVVAAFFGAGSIFEIIEVTNILPEGT